MRRTARWLPPDEPPREVDDLPVRLGVTAPAARVLWHRGYRDAQAVRRYLRPELTDLHDPGLMTDMKRATSRLVEAVRGREKILLYGDYDVDGSTAVVILKKAIELAGGSAAFHVPDRLSEGYGMRPAVIEQAAAAGVSLIISVDTGIRAVEAVERAAELGIDVVITDHHLPEEVLPPAHAVLNPNRRDCRYPEKNLCGAGVTFKLIQSMLDALGWPAERVRRVSESCLKMVSIATVADVAPLVGENRVIVRHGLDGLRDVRNAGLRALLEAAGFSRGQRPSAGQVAFRVAPRINAAGRMAQAADVVELFLTADPARARELAGRLDVLNRERQEAESAIVADILRQCELRPVRDDQAALVFDGEGWHRGVVGIVASRLVERFHRPVFVLSVDPEAEEAQGSARSIPGFHLLEALESMSDLFTRFGGHRQAAGLALPRGAVDDFRRRISAYAAEHLGADALRPVIPIDARVTFSELDDRSAADLLALEPFGAGNPVPLLVAEDVTLDHAPIPFADKHLRMPLRQGGRLFWMKAWNGNGQWPELEAGTRLDVVFSVEEDAYSAARGYPGWSLTLKDVRPVSVRGD